MARYAQRFKDRAVARLLPPENASVELVSRELGVGIATLERWRCEALSLPQTERAWTAAARLEAVITTASLDETAKGAWCREHGIYPSDLKAWQDQAIRGLSEPEETPSGPERADKRRIKELAREIRRKDKALAETAASLVLSKKLSAIFSEGAETDCAERSPNPSPKHPGGP